MYLHVYDYTENMKLGEQQFQKYSLVELKVAAVMHQSIFLTTVLYVVIFYTVNRPQILIPMCTSCYCFSIYCFKNRSADSLQMSISQKWRLIQDP